MLTALLSDTFENTFLFSRNGGQRCVADYPLRRSINIAVYGDTNRFSQPAYRPRNEENPWRAPFLVRTGLERSGIEQSNAISQLGKQSISSDELGSQQLRRYRCDPGIPAITCRIRFLFLEVKK